MILYTHTTDFLKIHKSDIGAGFFIVEISDYKKTEQYKLIIK